MLQGVKAWVAKYFQNSTNRKLYTKTVWPNIIFFTLLLSWVLAVGQNTIEQLEQGWLQIINISFFVC
jgi:hypothetical protein